MRPVKALNAVVEPIVISARSRLIVAETPIDHRGRAERGSIYVLDKPRSQKTYLAAGLTFDINRDPGSPSSLAKAQSIRDDVARRPIDAAMVTTRIMAVCTW